IAASDSCGNIDAVAFGDAAAVFAGILANENLVVISGKTSNRDDRVSIFVDSIIPMNQWVANVARQITLDVWTKDALMSVKKSLATLSGGTTRIVLKLHGADKTASMALPTPVTLLPTTIDDFRGLGIKVTVE
ncbi:MAG: hypothetical protein ACLRFJ_02800, partial [Alphaproteobacteria bacterium]